MVNPNPIPDIRALEFHSILVPLDPGIWVVYLAPKFQLLLRDTVLALLKLFGETKFWVSSCKVNN